MKIISGLLVIIFLLLYSCDTFFDQNPQHIVYKIESKISKKIERKFNVFLRGVGGSIPDKIRVMSVTYEYNGNELSLDDARVLLISIIQFFLDEVNTDEKIKPFLNNFPFKVENLQVSIVFQTKEKREVHDPFIYLAFSNKDQIYYFTKEPNQIQDKKEYKETYEEALAIVQKEKAQ